MVTDIALCVLQITDLERATNESLEGIAQGARPTISIDPRTQGTRKVPERFGYLPNSNLDHANI